MHTPPRWPVPLLLLLPLAPGCGGQGGASRAATAAALGSAPAVGALSGVDLTIEAPPDASSWPVGEVEVRGRVGPDAVEVLVVGQPAALSDGAFTARVGLQAGLNPLLVESRDAAGRSAARLLSLLAGDLRPEGTAAADGAEVRLTGSGAAARAGRIGAPAPSAAAGFPPMRWIPADPGNFRRGSGARRIRWIVVHTIEGSEAGAISWIRNPASNVSAHYVLSRTGRVTQMVRDEDVAYHVRAQNPEAIGIENEGYAGRNLWTDVQYETLARLVRALAVKHGVPLDRQHIVGHGELPGQTHWDPGPHFDWSRFMRLVRASGGPAAPAARARALTAPNGAEVDLELSVAPAEDDAQGRSVVIGSAARARTPRHDVGGTPAASGARAGLGGRSGPDWEAGIAVHEDALRGTLLAAWRAGALDWKLDPSSLMQLAPATAGALDAAALIARDPALAGLLQAGEQLELRLSADLPPLVSVTPGAPRPLRLELGALRLDVGVYHPLRQERRRLGRLDLSLAAGAEVEVAGDDAALRPDAPEQVRVGLAGHEPGVDPALLRALGRALAPTLTQAAAGALRGVSLPLPERLALVPVRAEAEGHTLVLLGR